MRYESVVALQCMSFQPNVPEFLTKWSTFSWKVEEELTNTLKEEIQNNYGVKIDSTTNANVDNLQIRVSNFTYDLDHRKKFPKSFPKPKQSAMQPRSQALSFADESMRQSLSAMVMVSLFNTEILCMLETSKLEEMRRVTIRFFSFSSSCFALSLEKSE